MTMQWFGVHAEITNADLRYDKLLSQWKCYSHVEHTHVPIIHNSNVKWQQYTSTVSHKKWHFVLAITLPNVNWFSNSFTARRRMKFAKKSFKNFHHTLYMLLHYLAKYKHSKMTHIEQKLQQSLTILKFCTSVIDTVTESAQNILL